MCFAAPAYRMVISGLPTTNLGAFALGVAASAPAAGLCCEKRWQQCTKLMTKNTMLTCALFAAPVQTGPKL